MRIYEYPRLSSFHIFYWITNINSSATITLVWSNLFEVQFFLEGIVTLSSARILILILCWFLLIIILRNKGLIIYLLVLLLFVIIVCLELRCHYYMIYLLLSLELHCSLTLIKFLHRNHLLLLFEKIEVLNESFQIEIVLGRVDPEPPVHIFQEGGFKEVQFFQRDSTYVGYEMISIENIIVEFWSHQSGCQYQPI